MLSSINLDKNWKVRGFDGLHGSPDVFTGSDADECTFIDAQVPGEIHLDLERADIISDCRVGLNAQSARWVEEQVWVYRSRFAAPCAALVPGRRVWLVFDGLDLDAVIYLNGQKIGKHQNAFVPLRLDITGKLHEGENILAVSINSGLYFTAEKSGTDYNTSAENLLTKRQWLRKPQYCFGWDWNPRLVNVGICKPVRLEWTDSARIDAVTVYSDLAEDHSRAKIYVRAFVENVNAEPVKAVIRLRVPEADVMTQCEVELPPGISRQDISADIANPRLWWPRPHGDQALYGVECEVEIDGTVVDQAIRRTGIRSIKINQDPHPDTGEYFILEVNGRKIFAKGGNWVPPDIIYARPDAAAYRRLVELAVEANFNALRIWGGGLYADHSFLDACDELGVLVWHDFLFACSKYPGEDSIFLKNVRQEITFAIRDLSPHASLLVWCGNNELEWGIWEGADNSGKCGPDYALYHHVIPSILRQEDPSRPYWPSSPYSLGHRYPNDPTTGDQHPWHVTLFENGPNFWAYRNDVSRFPNEGGVLGASSPATLAQFLPKDQQRLRSPSWEFHDNSCNYWAGGSPGIMYRMIDYWLGRQAQDMPLEDYVFFSALLQSEGLKEYIDNFRRRMFGSSSAVFWMYNDSWPATHGWTILDYYLRRKLAYHPVRRAFAPVRIIPAVENDRVLIVGVNETPNTWQGEARFGIFKLDGGYPVDETVSVTLHPNTAVVIGEIPVSQWRQTGADTTGAFALLIDNGCPLSQNRIFISPFKELKFEKPQISVYRNGNRAVFISPTFVWGVCLDIDGEKPLADDVFDLLPDIEYEIDWPEDRPLPEAQKCGNDFAHPRPSS